MHTRRQLADDLRALGIAAGDVVMTHASVSTVAGHDVRVWRDMEEFDTSAAGVHGNWPDRLFARLVDGFLAATRNTGGQVGSAWCYLLPARGLLAFARPIMGRLAVDPRAADHLQQLRAGPVRAV